MKKIAALLVLMAFLLLDTAAQDFLPVLRTDAEWSISHPVKVPVGMEFFDFNYFTEHYRLGGDSIIDGINWKMIFYSSDSTFSWDDPEFQFGGLIREEAGKVYYKGNLFRYLPDDGVIYDFNLNEGDVFWEGLDDTAAPCRTLCLCGGYRYFIR